MLEILLNNGLFFAICYIANIIGKCIVAKIVSNNNKMSDEKVKYLTQMMSKDIVIEK